ncbi:MAG: DUF485 domain-containing protein [Pseudonocardia sp.]|nr:DUF485 domain-containing protein [Pseudonocardia sp.]
MTTSTDGARSSVSDEPGARTADHRVGDTGPGGPDADTGSAWLVEEIQRRIAAKNTGTGGRHARRSATERGAGAAGASEYVPRHSVLPPGAGGRSSQRPGPPRPSQAPPPREHRGGSAPAAWSGPSRLAPVSPAPPLRPASLLAVPPSPDRPSPSPSGSAGAPLPVSLTPGSGFGAPPATYPGTPTFEPRPKRRAGRVGRRAAGRVVAPPKPDSHTDVVDEVLWSAGAPPADLSPPQGLTTLGARLLSMEEAETESPAPGKRVRVVLAERKGVARPVRTVVDIQEGTGVGELLRTNLIGSQLAVSLRFAIGVGLTLGALPLLFALVPEIGRLEVFGLRLPWLLLGVLVYPFLLVLAWWYTRTAERVEQNFADHVQD